MEKWGTVALPKDLIEKLRTEAKAQDRSLSWLLRHVVEQHLLTKGK
jgi:predicted transcriptional regulator